ncbi:AraC family transcriptional regulator [Agrobacterium rhizogenes]|uniref:AraC family transcriptional regulator n=1 Tax=Rhizobium rhizogenes TaxID=359 RepID=UPI00064790D7|nr:AraC family transcriptional regulator [Rhizobium rhizogenes]NTF90100.1 AraC family transcriptional regulator [Rhizobium rhizogenes]NTG76869.1 AraC family transcriptional regulator [Rhizobium rhizogenes]NTH15499.1 AraC family transcriptional regulator [Rhizobium rhizogenes]NTI77253.1 AraC family transcriptional regulator [Rhizobium rhizogenes]
MQREKPGSSLTFRGNDADEFSEILSRCKAPARVEALRDAGFSAEYDFVAAEALGVGRAAYQGGLRFHQKAEDSKFLIYVPLSGAAMISSSNRHHVSEPGKGTIIDMTSLSDVVIEGDREHLSLIINQNEVVRLLSAMLEQPISGSIDLAPEFDLRLEAGLAFSRVTTILATGLNDDASLLQSPAALSCLSTGLIHLLLENVPHRFSGALARQPALPSPRHIRRAIDFMQANLSQPISIGDIAQASQVGIRSLQEGFKRFKGMSPMAYLANLRMEAAHRDLIMANPATSVAAIAQKWGFTHLGRFSGDYRKSYGCLPSHTLRSGHSVGADGR